MTERKFGMLCKLAAEVDQFFNIATSETLGKVQFN